MISRLNKTDIGRAVSNALLQSPECKDLNSTDCGTVRRNYLLNVANGAASKLAEQLASVKLVFPWLLASIGAPAVLIGFLIPLRQAGALLPQLLVSGRIRAVPVRKWFWVVTALIQVALLVAMLTGVLVVESSLAAVAIPLLILLYAIARGVGSIAFQDVTGKTIPKGIRGRMLASRSAIGGLLTIATGLVLKLWLSDDTAVIGSITALLLAALFWGAAAAAFAAIRETPGATAKARSTMSEVRAGFALLATRRWYARYLGVRILLLSLEMAIPFYVLYGRQNLTNAAGVLGLMVVAAGLSQAISSPFWGRFADMSSRKVLILSGLFGAAAAALAVLFGYLPSNLQSPYLFAGLIILLGVAEAGAILGRKTYLIDNADETDRPTYVAFSNSIVGLAMLALGGIGVLAQYAGPQYAIAALSLMALLGSAVALGLPDDARSEPVNEKTRGLSFKDAAHES